MGMNGGVVPYDYPKDLESLMLSSGHWKAPIGARKDTDKDIDGNDDKRVKDIPTKRKSPKKIDRDKDPIKGSAKRRKLEEESKECEQLKDEIDSLRKQLAERDRAIVSKNETIEKISKENDDTIRQKDDTIRQKDNTIRQKDDTIRRKDDTIRQKDDIINLYKEA